MAKTDLTNVLVSVFKKKKTKFTPVGEGGSGRKASATENT